eukprot:gene31327-6474_t
MGGAGRKLTKKGDASAAMVAAINPILSASQSVQKQAQELSSKIDIIINDALALSETAIVDGNANHAASVEHIIDAMEAQNQNDFYQYSSEAKDSSVDLALTAIQLPKTMVTSTQLVSDQISDISGALHALSLRINKVERDLNRFKKLYPGWTLDPTCTVAVLTITLNIQTANSVPAKGASAASTVEAGFQADIKKLQDLSGSSRFDSSTLVAKWVPLPTGDGLGAWTWNSFNPYTWAG